jgi:hypothetical protein
MSSAEPERELDRLFGLPLGEFVAARDALARQARSDGDRGLAERIKGLRKPTVAAYVVNRLARERELDVQRLLKAGEELSRTQREASAESFGEARREEQRALDRLAAAAREIAERDGLGAGVVERVTQSLRAGSVTDEGRELLWRGRLTEDLQPAGFEALLGAAPTRPPRGRRQARAADTKAKEQDERRRRVAEAEAAVKQLRTEARQLEKAAVEAERQADRAERDAARLRETAERARSEAENGAQRRDEAEVSLRQLKRSGRRT